MRTVRAADLKPGDVIVESPITVLSVTPRRNTISGQVMYDVRRVSDGRVDLSLYPDDQVTVR